MDIFTWLVVGLAAGALASVIMGEYGFGLLGDLVLGVIGAFVGSWAFHELGWSAPFPGLAGIIAVALVGAVIVLFAVRLIRSAAGTRSR
jgi:uncharacterized membrane protein YeaQ/YmgE (transglycosylase-associated protein family)